VPQLLQLLPEYVLQWLVQKGSERLVREKEALVRAGDRCDSLFIVLDGSFTVVGAERDRIVEQISSGNLAGDLSYFSGEPSTTSIIADEPSLVMEIRRGILDAKLEHDHGYAADLYKALITSMAARFESVAPRVGPEREHGFAHDPAVVRAQEQVDAFKQLMTAIDKEALKNGAISEDSRRAFMERSHHMMYALHDTLGDGSPLDPAMRKQLGVRLQHEMLPYLLTTHTAERFYSKPRGYAGDFLAIHKIYENQPSGTGRLGPLVDRMFLEMPPSIAVRNRRMLLAEEIKATVDRKSPGRANVMCIASGPATEVFDAFAAIPDQTKLKVTLLDIDLQALAFVDEIRTKRKLAAQFELVNENLIALFLGRGKLQVEPQDLIYSIGLIDYLNDKLVGKLLAFAYSNLAPGGRIILGNFHPSNPAREFMDHVLEWSLIHRTEEDMNRLFSSSPFNKSCTNITFEGTGIDLFAECVK
jgi:SAM-dependent methyltransferase